MKRGNTFSQVFKNGCVIFTIITLIIYGIGTLLSNADKAFIPTFQWILLFLYFLYFLAAPIKFCAWIASLFRCVFCFTSLQPPLYMLQLSSCVVAYTKMVSCSCCLSFCLLQAIFCLPFYILSECEEPKERATKKTRINQYFINL